MLQPSNTVALIAAYKGPRCDGEIRRWNELGGVVRIANTEIGCCWGLIHQNPGTGGIGGIGLQGSWEAINVVNDITRIHHQHSPIVARVIFVVFVKFADIITSRQWIRRRGVIWGTHTPPIARSETAHRRIANVLRIHYGIRTIVNTMSRMCVDRWIRKLIKTLIPRSTRSLRHKARRDAYCRAPKGIQVQHLLRKRHLSPQQKHCRYCPFRKFHGYAPFYVYVIEFNR